MSHGTTCKCPGSKLPHGKRPWVITQYRCNHSAFNGNRRTPSDYSAMRCEQCGSVWRTKADYVAHYPTTGPRA